MKRWFIGLSLSFWLVGLLGATGLTYQMTPDEVRAAAGPPTSLLERGDRAIWMYPDGGRVEFENGLAAEIVNMLMATEAEIIEAEAAVAEAEQLAAEEVAQLEDEETELEQAAMAKLEAEMAAAYAESLELTSQSIEEMTAHHEGGGIPDLDLAPPPPSQYWLGLAVQSVLGLLVTMVVLKLAFRWADVHADWGQMFLPALVNMLVGTLVRGIGYALLKTDHFYHIDDGLSFFALLITLKLTTHASTMQRAMSVAVAAKVASIIVWTLLSVVILQSLFG